VEHILHVRARQQLQAVGDVVDDGGIAVRAVEMRLQLSRRRSLVGGRCALMEAEPDPVTHGVLGLFVDIVVVDLVHHLACSRW